MAGFTVFKISMTLMILGAVWGLLTSTRLLRGEEESGRWELLLAGQTTRRGCHGPGARRPGRRRLARCGRSPRSSPFWSGLDASVDIAAGPSLYFALAMVATAVMFLAVGALTSQLGATRRQAASYAAVVPRRCYAVRMIADAGVGLHGLIWASPLGWVEELRPLTAPQPLALLPDRRLHRGAGRRRRAPGRHPRRRGEHRAGPGDQRAAPRLLSGPTGLAIRLVRPTVIGWWAAIAVSGLLYGLIAKSAGGTISGSSVHKVFSKLGASGTGADAVLGVCFLVLAVLVAFVGAGQLTAARSEESEGRLDHLLVRPVSRTSWLGGKAPRRCRRPPRERRRRGRHSRGSVPPASTRESASPRCLEAGVNLVPPAVAILGIGVLTFGIRPRMVSVVVYTLLGWSLLIVIVGGIGAVDHWVLDTSVFHQMASAPAVSPHWEANGIMMAIGCTGALLGGLAFRRRDLQGE